MPQIGDRIRVHSAKVDQPPREGVVTSASGAMLRIKWSTGEETTMIPGPGSVAVIGKVRKASVPAKKATKPTKTAPTSKKTAK